MNNNMLAKQSFLIFFFIANLYPQNNFVIEKCNSTSPNDTINPSSYFPMSVNNFWQYSFLNDVIKEEFVYKDSTLSDSSKAYYLLTNGVPFIYPNYIIKNYNVYSGHPLPENRDFYWKLDAELNEEWWVYRWTGDTTQGVYRKVDAIFDDTYLGENTSFKEISEYTRELLIDSTYLDIFRFRYWLAAGFGLVITTTDQMGEPPTYLNSAIINGDTIGTIVTVKNIEKENLLPEIELLPNYPNPFNSITNINFVLRKPSFIHLSLFNVLGQEIKTIRNGFFSIGEYSVKIDMEVLSSGIY
ncbi:MAG: T9SS type A sorting domain-containing protein, partial [Ignavibacteriaceae bacterium]|nr:T9SS type A sorting domain-containing protein [Ignavibacteriaceae bacterium]